MTQIYINTSGQYNKEETFTEEHTVIGKVDNLVDHNGKRIVSGDWDFPGDILPGKKLFTGIKFCPHAHATIKGVTNVAEVEQMPGVKAVVTYMEVPTPAMPKPSGSNTTREITYEGMCVAAVAATDPWLANYAANALEVEYDLHPFVVDMDEAWKNEIFANLGATNPNNIGSTSNVMTRGDVEAGFAVAERIVNSEDRGFSGWSSYYSHNTPEPREATVQWLGKDEVRVWTGSQDLAGHTRNISANLGVPNSKCRLTSHGCGGGYGDRKSNGEEAWIAGLLAKKAGMPVNCMCSRHVNATGGATHQYQQRAMMKVGGTRRIGGSPATINAIDAHWYGNSGPIHLQLTYKANNVRIRANTIATNIPRTGPFRSVTGMHSCFVSDQAFDQLAYELGMNPVDFRRDIAVRLEDLDQSAANPVNPNPSKALVEVLDECAQKFNWYGKYHEPGKDNVRPDGRLHGVGSCYTVSEKGSSSSGRTVIVRVAPDGSVHVNCGIGNAASGTHTALAVVVAEAMGSKMDDVNVTAGEAQFAGYGGNQAGSQGTMANAYGAYEAAKKALGVMMNSSSARNLLDGSDDSLVSEYGTIHSLKTPSRSITHAQAVSSEIIAHGDGSIIGNGLKRPVLSWPRGRACTLRTYVAEMVEIAVDKETGEIEVLDWVMVDDVGKVLFRKGVQAQFNGGMAMQYGFVFGWEQLFDPGTGATLNGDFLNQKNPTSLDLPVDKMKNFMYQSDNAAAIYGGYGCGEPPCICYAAFHNAFYNATGKRIAQTLMYPARVLEALGAI